MREWKVGILGATGLVGQRLVERLIGHPWFQVVGLGASERSTAVPYGEVVRWRLSADPPAEAASMTVRPCDAAEFQDCDLVFSALDALVAREVEPAFVRSGLGVVSNSSAFRRDAGVPLVVPEVNGAHLEMLRDRKGDGFLVTNPNCSVTGLAMAVAPIHRAFGLRRLNVATLQAVSGAGAAGPRALDLLGNVVPHIPGEEDKIEVELAKILGKAGDGRYEPAGITVSAHCHRVPTLDGHLEAVSLETVRPATADEVRDLLESSGSDLDGLELPSAPRRPVIVRHEPDRPQPALDRDEEGGMAVVVGRIRACPVLGVKLELLSHNTVRGAAGCTILIAELLVSRELVRRRNSR